MDAANLVIRRPEGLYCPAGDFFIDPMRAVPRAVITHAHADHARGGHGHVLAAAPGVPVLLARLGRQPVQALRYGEAVEHRGVRISLHPAGHVLGSAQVRLAHGGRVWVVSGDYFVSTQGDANPTCEPFEPVACDVFVTESTFALPLYRWAPQRDVLSAIDAWWQRNAADGATSLVQAYSFGKAQRLLAGVSAGIGPLWVHDSVQRMNLACIEGGMALPAVQVLRPGVAAQALRGALVVMPPQGSAALPDRLGEVRSAFASGWMQLAAARRRLGGGQGFALSDHADWPGLLCAIRASGAPRVVVHHGQAEVLVRWLAAQGLQAQTFDAPAAAAPA